MTGKPKADSLESKFKLMQLLPFDKRMKRKHILVYGFILDWFHSKYGDALASSRHVLAELKERDPFEHGLFMGDVHSALTELVAWGYLSQDKGSGRRASRYVPVWSIFDSVQKTPNATDDQISVLESPNTSVLETPNATGDSVQETPNKDPSTGPGLLTRGHVDGNIFSDPASPPLAVGLVATAAVRAEGGRFGEFWQAWPRKHGKKKAEAEWKRLEPDADMTSHIIVTARIWAEHYEKHSVDMKYIPEPANWLKLERYDEALPLIHGDAKGAAIAKAKANSFPKSDAPKTAKLKPDNDNEDNIYVNGPMICDVGPFTPFGSFEARIVGAEVSHPDAHTEKIVISLQWNDRGFEPDAVHTLYNRHPDPAIQARGQDFLKTLVDVVGLTEITDANELLDCSVYCTINNRLAISYEEAA